MARGCHSTALMLLQSLQNLGLWGGTGSSWIQLNLLCQPRLLPWWSHHQHPPSFWHCLLGSRHFQQSLLSAWLRNCCAVPIRSALRVQNLPLIFALKSFKRPQLKRASSGKQYLLLWKTPGSPDCLWKGLVCELRQDHQRGAYEGSAGRVPLHGQL